MVTPLLLFVEVREEGLSQTMEPLGDLYMTTVSFDPKNLADPSKKTWTRPGRSSKREYRDVWDHLNSELLSHMDKFLFRTLNAWADDMVQLGGLSVHDSVEAIRSYALSFKGETLLGELFDREFEAVQPEIMQMGWDLYPDTMERYFLPPYWVGETFQSAYTFVCLHWDYRSHLKLRGRARIWQESSVASRRLNSYDVDVYLNTLGMSARAAARETGWTDKKIARMRKFFGEMTSDQLAEWVECQEKHKQEQARQAKISKMREDALASEDTYVVDPFPKIPEDAVRPCQAFISRREWYVESHRGRRIGPDGAMALSYEYGDDAFPEDVYKSVFSDTVGGVMLKHAAYAVKAYFFDFCRAKGRSRTPEEFERFLKREDMRGHIQNVEKVYRRDYERHRTYEENLRKEEATGRSEGSGRIRSKALGGVNR